METKEMTKWFRYLLYVHLAGIALSLINAGSLSWLMLACNAAEVYCIYRLIPLGERYQKAFTFAALVVGLNLLNRLLGSSTLVILAVSILGFIATWQEYHAHSELVAPLDEKLSRNWHNLFWWELAVGVTTSILTMAATVILVLGEIGTAAITGIITLLMNGVMAVVGIVYLVYLNRTAKLMEG